MVWRLDRLGRSLPHLITTMTDVEERGIGFKSLTENIDTTTSGGKLIFHIFGALAEFERNLIRERTQAGLTEPVPEAKEAVDPRPLPHGSLVLPMTSMRNDTPLRTFAGPSRSPEPRCIVPSRAGKDPSKAQYSE
jgi:DNA invertase Pin-like site-specific DNA recombinase